MNFLKGAILGAFVGIFTVGGIYIGVGLWIGLYEPLIAWGMSIVAGPAVCVSALLMGCAGLLKEDGHDGTSERAALRKAGGEPRARE